MLAASPESDGEGGRGDGVSINAFPIDDSANGQSEGAATESSTQHPTYPGRPPHTLLESPPEGPTTLDAPLSRDVASMRRSSRTAVSLALARPVDSLTNPLSTLPPPPVRSEGLASDSTAAESSLLKSTASAAAAADPDTGDSLNMGNPTGADGARESSGLPPPREGAGTSCEAAKAVQASAASGVRPYDSISALFVDPRTVATYTPTTESPRSEATATPRGVAEPPAFADAAGGATSATANAALALPPLAGSADTLTTRSPTLMADLPSYHTEGDAVPVRGSGCPRSSSGEGSLGGDDLINVANASGAGFTAGEVDETALILGLPSAIARGLSSAVGVFGDGGNRSDESLLEERPRSGAQGSNFSGVVTSAAVEARGGISAREDSRAVTAAVTEALPAANTRDDSGRDGDNDNKDKQLMTAPQRRAITSSLTGEADRSEKIGAPSAGREMTTAPASTLAAAVEREEGLIEAELRALVPTARPPPMHPDAPTPRRHPDECRLAATPRAAVSEMASPAATVSNRTPESRATNLARRAPPTSPPAPSLRGGPRVGITNLAADSTSRSAPRTPTDAARTSPALLVAPSTTLRAIATSLSMSSSSATFALRSVPPLAPSPSSSASTASSSGATSFASSTPPAPPRAAPVTALSSTAAPASALVLTAPQPALPKLPSAPAAPLAPAAHASAVPRRPRPAATGDLSDGVPRVGSMTLTGGGDNSGYSGSSEADAPATDVAHAYGPALVNTRTSDKTGDDGYFADDDEAVGFLEPPRTIRVRPSPGLSADGTAGEPSEGGSRDASSRAGEGATVGSGASMLPRAPAATLAVTAPLVRASQLPVGQARAADSGGLHVTARMRTAAATSSSAAALPSSSGAAPPSEPPAGATLAPPSLVSAPPPLLPAATTARLTSPATLLADSAAGSLRRGSAIAVAPSARPNTLPSTVSTQGRTGSPSAGENRGRITTPAPSPPASTATPPDQHATLPAQQRERLPVSAALESMTERLRRLLAGVTSPGGNVHASPGAVPAAAGAPANGSSSSSPSPPPPPSPASSTREAAVTPIALRATPRAIPPSTSSLPEALPRAPARSGIVPISPAGEVDEASQAREQAEAAAGEANAAAVAARNAAAAAAVAATSPTARPSEGVRV